MARLFVLMMGFFMTNACVSVSAPVALKQPKTLIEHGKPYQDVYAWILPEDWDPVEGGTKNKEVLKYIEAENAFARQEQEKYAVLTETIFNEIKSHVPEVDESLPEAKGAYWYFSRRKKDQQYAVHFRRHRSTQEEQMILDENALAAGKDFFSLETQEVSVDGNLLLFGTDETGKEQPTLRVKNLADGQLLIDEITDTTGSAIWHPHLPGFFYSRFNEKAQPKAVFFHYLGRPVKEDVLVYEEEVPQFFLGMGKSKDEAYLFLHSGDHQEHAIRVLPLSKNPIDKQTLPPIRLLVKQQPERKADATHAEGYFYIHTNDGKQDFRIARVKEGEFSEAAWETVVSPGKDEFISNFDVVNHHLVAEVKRLGVNEYHLRPLGDFSSVKKLTQFPEPVYAASLCNEDQKDQVIYLCYSSPQTPSTLMAYDFKTEQLSKLAQKQVPHFDSENYAVERVWAKSHDGTKVPLTLFYRKDKKLASGNPTILNGYGAYGMPWEVNFSKAALPYVDRGFIYAMAHIRGGDELGYGWYLDGKLQKKINTFRDFIAAAEYLYEAKWTAPGQLGIYSGSAGGLLVGYFCNERPDLLGAAAVRVPFVDLVSTMFFTKHPLTEGEYVEWGNPHDKAAYDYMLSYDPYRNVKPHAYPPLLVTAGLTDPRVGFWEPLKWVAKLRATKTDKHPLIMETHMGAGHFGKTGLDGEIENSAKIMAFIISNVG